MKHVLIFSHGYQTETYSQKFYTEAEKKVVMCPLLNITV